LPDYEGLQEAAVANYEVIGTTTIIAIVLNVYLLIAKDLQGDPLV
jgi:hypothetical protein